MPCNLSSHDATKGKRKRDARRRGGEECARAYDAVAGRGRSSGEPPSRPLADPGWLREEGLRCLLAGA